MDTGFRITTPLGSRIDLDKVSERLDVLLDSLLGEARSTHRGAPQRMREAALEIAYLARLKAEALARNGRALQAAQRASA